MNRRLVAATTALALASCSPSSVPMSVNDARWVTSAGGRVEVEFRLTNEEGRSGVGSCQVVATDADGRRVGSDRVSTSEDVGAGASLPVQAVTGIDAAGVAAVQVDCR